MRVLDGREFVPFAMVPITVTSYCTHSEAGVCVCACVCV